MNKTVYTGDWGRIGYNAAWRKQDVYFQATIDRKVANRKQSTAYPTDNYLFFCEHPPVYTLGKSGKAENLLSDESEPARKGVEFVRTNRGGDITFHGPGQIVGYPVLDLDNFYTDIHRYMREIEEVVIRTLADYGITAGRYEGYTGVWLEADHPERARKICAQGVKCSRWVTMHGFALNVNTDLTYFDHIIPCGITDKAVTSLQAELGRRVELAEVKRKLRRHFKAVFEAELQPLPEPALSEAG